MTTKGLCILCALLASTAVVLAQAPVTSPSAAATGRVPGTTEAIETAIVAEEGMAIELSPTDPGRGERACGSTCPTGYLAGQNQGLNTWNLSDLTFTNPGIGVGRIVCERYPCPGETVTKPVGIVTWWGTYLNNATNDGCTKPHSFQIKFYPSLGGTGYPDTTNPACSMTLVPALAEKTGRQLNFGGTVLADEYRFVAVISAPCALTAGWFSVASTVSLTDCYHYWGPSDEDDQAYFRYWTDNPTNGALFAGVSQAFCFGELKLGVCCNDRTRVCNPNSNDFVCQLQGGRFAASPTTCATLDPLCGDAPGACCAENNTCTITTYALCTGRWLGPWTTCDQCCTVYCQPGGNWIPEGEPDCGAPTWDDINAGCFVAGTPAFMNITCGNTICGSTGLYGCRGDLDCNGQVDFADINPFVNALLNSVYCDGTGDNADVSGNGIVGFEDINPFVALLTQNPLPILCFSGPGLFNDVDVYKYTSVVPTKFTWSVRAETDVQAQVWNAQSGNCADDWAIDFENAAPCVDASVLTRCLPGGTYYFVVINGTAEVSCNWDYKAWLICTTPCEPCLATCPGGATVEPEACGEDTNLGCSGTPAGPFTQLTFDPNGQVVICGKLFADDGTRDPDWYQFQLNGPTQTTFTFSNEVPIESSVYAKDPFPTPAGCDDVQWIFVDRFYPLCGPTTKSFYLPAGLWTLYVIPADADGGIFYGYPCFTGDNDYVMTILAPEPNCPTLMDAACASAPQENEWDPNSVNCFDGYVDNFNPGCDNGNPGPMINITPGNDLCGLYSGGNDYILCGKAGAYVTGTQKYDSDWFVFTLGAGDLNYICIAGQSEMPLEYDFYDAALGCAGTPLYSGYFAHCTASPDEDPIPPYNVGDPVPPALPAGTYWLRIGLTTGSDTIPCDADYGLILGCRQCPEPVK